MIPIIIISIVIVSLVLLRIFRMNVLQWAMNLRAKLRIRSLRVAINDADEDKKETDRKNIVVYNIESGKYEPVQKKLLKTIERQTKNKNNARMTEGRKWFLKQQQKKKKKILTTSVNEIEKKSLYVTE